MADAAYAIVGGGLVGHAIAWGLARRGHQVTIFDEGDRAFRASRGNFGLVWVQSKGAAMPNYARWSRLSARLWPAFRDELTATTEIDLHLSQPGGLQIFLDEEEAEANVAMLTKLREALDGDYPFEVLGHNAVKERIPEIGPDVVGATYGPEDGHVNPLHLFRALSTAINRAGVTLVNGATVERIEHDRDGFKLQHGARSYRADNVVLCAGLGNARLAPMVGLHAPVKPNRGQVLITERVRPFLKYPTGHVRQVGEGAVQLGDSKEDVGFDDSTRGDVAAAIARRATRTFPLLKSVRVVRSWSALRIMSPDGHPIYDKSESCPGASVVTCHSGVTLAAAHANVLAGWICGAEAPDYMEDFGAERFALQKAG